LAAASTRARRGVALVDGFAEPPNLEPVVASVMAVRIESSEGVCHPRIALQANVLMTNRTQPPHLELELAHLSPPG